MNKTFLIIGREYFTRVKKKSFLITTILVPLVIVAFYAIIIAVSVKGSTEETKLAVIDEAGLFSDSTLSGSKALKLTFIKNETEQSFTGKYKEQGYDGFLYVPVFDINKQQKFVVHSQSSLSLGNNIAIEKYINKAIENKRLIAKGIDPAVFKSISADAKVENTIDTEEGSKKGSAGVAFAVSFACGILIYMMMIIYGTQVMRGVMEEKTNRIAEVIVSSVKPFQLMLGKIIGIGAVGLTQFAIWIVIMVVLQSAIPLIFPDLMQQVTSGAAADVDDNMMATITQGLSSLPLAKILFLFLFYFLAGYLTYASLFAAVGSVVSEDQQDAQQLVFPILMPIILGFVIMTNSINNPHSNMAVFGSIFPLTSPIVMMGRIT
ncbi:MAG TPA: ABC transporter permease, partial [Ferruginibacter sp.]|nr:ABC transporter permease [Ferruginibacter sp.]